MGRFLRVLFFPFGWSQVFQRSLARYIETAEEIPCYLALLSIWYILP